MYNQKLLRLHKEDMLEYAGATFQNNSSRNNFSKPCHIENCYGYTLPLS